MTADARMPTDREIVITRLINAPRELVFDAWTDPEQVGQWWGPSGFTNTTHKMEVKPGGVWRFVMHAPSSSPACSMRRAISYGRRTASLRA